LLPPKGTLFALGRPGGKKTGLQHATQARLAFDVCALRLQTGNVAVQRAQADAHLIGQGLPADGVATAAQALHQFQQSLGAGHKAP